MPKTRRIYLTFRPINIFLPVIVSYPHPSSPLQHYSLRLVIPRQFRFFIRHSRLSLSMPATPPSPPAKLPPSSSGFPFPFVSFLYHTCHPLLSFLPFKPFLFSLPLPLLTPALSPQSVFIPFFFSFFFPILPSLSYGQAFLPLFCHFLSWCVIVPFSCWFLFSSPLMPPTSSFFSYFSSVSFFLFLFYLFLSFRSPLFSYSLSHSFASTLYFSSRSFFLSIPYLPFSVLLFSS